MTLWIAQIAGSSPVALAISLLIGIALGVGALYVLGLQRLRQARSDADQIVNNAQSEARNTAEKIKLDAEREALARKEQAENEFEKARNEFRQTEHRLGKREDQLERKEDKVSSREQTLAQRADEMAADRTVIDERRGELDRLITEQTDKLHQVASLTPERAKELLLERIADQTRDEAGHLVRDMIEKAEEEAREKAQEITLQAIQRFANESVAESTVRTVEIPSEDMKGRIIGREGRNIRAIEKATGADIIVDDTPGVIVVSCFDKVRQAVAVESMRRLVADGRVHPTRIEEIVDKVRAETQEKIIKVGKDTALEVKLKGLHPKVIEAMGRLHYRTSYGQNVLRHSVEVAIFSQIIAEQLGLDGRLARRCGYLHDIGKAMDHEMEGGHPAIGMNFARQHGEKDEAVLNAIGGHHADIPATTPYTPIVMAADAVSSARPGARRESMERYIQRLNELEDIARDQPGVTEAHAVQAGREVRVIIDADKASDDEAYLIAHEIAKRVSAEMTFPGEIRVTVMRETRAVEIAR